MSENESPLKRLLDAANDLIAAGLQGVARDDPTAHKAVVEFAAAGAIPQLVIETHPERTIVGLSLFKEGEHVRVLEFTAKRVPSARH